MNPRFKAVLSRATIILRLHHYHRFAWTHYIRAWLSGLVCASSPRHRGSHLLLPFFPHGDEVASQKCAVRAIKYYVNRTQD